MARKPKLPEGLWERDGVYYARFRANGREVRKRLSSDLRAAKELLNLLKARADKADFGLIDNDYPWQSLKDEFIRWARQTKRMADEWETDLGMFAAYCPVTSIRQITHDYIAGFRAWRSEQPGRYGQNISPRTINKQVAVLHNMLNRGVEWKRIGSNPIVGIEPLPENSPKKSRRSLTVDEVLAILDASPDYLKPVWRMFMVTGVRLDELVSMTFADVDFERRTVTVRAEAAKSGREREIPLDDTALAILTSLRDKASDRKPVKGLTTKSTAKQLANFSKEHVFVTTANTPHRNNLLTRFYMVCKRAGIADGCPGGSIDIHSLRVTFTTLSIDHGASPKAIQAILGHSTLDMTMGVYAKATERAKRDAVSALPFANASVPEHVVSVQNAHAMRTNKKTAIQTKASQ